MKFTLRFIGLMFVGVCMFPAVDVSAQSATAQLTFVPPISSNGPYAAQFTNTLSFNILVGVSANERALTVGGLANIIRYNSNGVQFAGLYNRVGTNGQGAMFAGLLNTVRFDYRGAQFAGLYNRIGTCGQGAMFSGLLNTVGFDYRGAQFAGLYNHISTNGRGAMFSGLLNTVAYGYHGMQVAGLANTAHTIHGVQLAGFINIAKYVSGAQIAGFINIADRSDTPIGLLNLIREGEMSVSVAYNEIGSTVVAFHSGGRYTYGILGAGYNHKTKGDAFVTIAGLGAHINCTPWFRINNELTVETIGNFSKNTVFRAGYALLPAFRIGKHFEVFGGASINYMHSDKMEDRNLFPNNSLWEKHSSARLQQIHIGYQCGIKYIFKNATPFARYKIRRLK